MSYKDAALSHKTLVSLLHWRSVHQPEQIAYFFLADGEHELGITYRELDRRARAIGANLEQQCPSHARVLLAYPAGIDAIVAFLGCLYAGMIAVPAYPPRNKRILGRLQSIIADSHIYAVLTTEHIFSSKMGQFTGVVDVGAIRWIVTDTVDIGMGDDWQEPPIELQDIALLQYTSGSVGVPKGVVVRHENLMHNLAMMCEHWRLGPDSVGVSWLPLFHDMGLIAGVLLPLFTGFRAVLMPPTAFLQRPLRWLQAISRYQGTISYAPNFAYELCVRKISAGEKERLDLRSWSVAVNGAEPIRPETLTHFVQSFGACGFRETTFVPGYGLAEATLMVSSADWQAGPTIRSFEKAALEQRHVVERAAGAEEARAYVGCGRVGSTDEEIIVVDPDSGRKCNENEIGEIWVAGSSIAGGYWGRNEETERVFQAFVADTGEGPFLRTGDLGFLWDQELFLCGRLKDVIIIRGQNHYPQDVEQTVDSCHHMLRPGCGAAFAIERDGQEQLVIAQEIERHSLAGEEEQIVAAIRRAVAEQHELQVYGVVLLKPGSIPKTSSGKIQRTACRHGFEDGSLEIVRKSILDGEDHIDELFAAAPTIESLCTMEPDEQRMGLQVYMQHLVAQSLHIPLAQIDGAQSLNALGCDSLMAIELKSAIEANLHVVVTIEDLLHEKTLHDLVALLQEQIGRSHSPDEHLTGEEDDLSSRPHRATEQRTELPLSMEQERLWLLDQLEPGNPAYNLPIAVRLSGPLQVAYVEQALRQMIERHETLRTVFLSRDGRPVLHVMSVLAEPFSVILLENSTGTEQEQTSRKLMREEWLQPFDLAQGPLFRVKLLRLAPEEHILLLTMHHIISDLWSISVFLHEFFALYEARATNKEFVGEDLPFQYSDFVAWQHKRLQSKALEEQSGYWKEQLKNVPSMLDEPTEIATQRFQTAHQLFTLPAELSKDLQSWSQQEDVTLFMTLFAAFTLVLGRFMDQSDVLVGVPFSGRMLSETWNMIGFFAHPLVFRTHLMDNPSLREVVARVQKVALEAYAHHETPFAKVVEVAHKAQGMRRGSLFQSMFSLVRPPIEATTFADITLTPLDNESGTIDTHIFLTFFITKMGLRGSLQYNAALFDNSSIEAFIDTYKQVLEQCIQRPEMQLEQLWRVLKVDKGLLGDKLYPHRQKITITATFTAEPVEDALSFWLRTLSLFFTIEFSSYSNVFQQLLDPTSLLSTTQNGINIILVRLEDWQRVGEECRTVANAVAWEEIQRNGEDFVAAMKVAATRKTTRYLVILCPVSQVLGADESLAQFFRDMECRIATQLIGSDNVSVVTSAELAELYPVAVTDDVYSAALGHIPYTSQFFVALGTIIARKLYVLQHSQDGPATPEDEQALWNTACAEIGGEIARQPGDPEMILQAIHAQKQKEWANSIHEQGAEIQPYAPPRTPDEKVLQTIMQNLLGPEQVGINDDFFAIGGHSLLAIQLLSRIYTHFQIELPLKLLFNGVSTIAKLAQAIEQEQIEQIDEQDIEEALNDLAALSDEDVAALLLEKQP